MKKIESHPGRKRKNHEKAFGSKSSNNHMGDDQERASHTDVNILPCTPLALPRRPVGIGVFAQVGVGVGGAGVVGMQQRNNNINYNSMNTGSNWR